MFEDLKTNRENVLIQTVMGSSYDRFFVMGLLIFLLIGCNNRKELLDQEVYEGPTVVMENIRTMMTDSGNQVMRLSAPLQLDFENGNSEWPEGLRLAYYIAGEVTPVCTFKSNYAIKLAEENLYRGEGDVIVKNLDNGDELNTEVLYWNPAEEKFYTDHFVTIKSEGEIHTGEGLEANQDFSSYRITKPSGTIQLEEEN